MANPISSFLDQHPDIKEFIGKLGKDNIGFLASAVAWTALTSIVPILVGFTAISGIILSGNPSAQQAVVTHLSAALQGVLSAHEIQSLVKVSVQHTGVLAIVGFLGVLWGGSNVGGTISTVFQPIFHVRGRSFIQEKLLDAVMIFVFAALMLVIIAATSSATLLGRLFPSLPIPGGTTFIIGTVVSLIAAFLLFAVIYMVFPNTETRFKLRNVWPGAAIAAVLFQILTYIWPIYSGFSHFSKYTAVLASLLVLTAWIYFFAMIMLFGAEFVAFGALKEAEHLRQAVGPAPDGSVPQHGDASPESLAVENRPKSSDQRQPAKR